MGPVLIWPNIIISVNVEFEKILAVTRVRHIESTKGLTVQMTI